ncbi:hypothetical protein ES703_77839 [subsurface metagenome]
MGLFKKDKKNSEASFSVEVKSSIGMGTDDTVQRLLKEASQKKRDWRLSLYQHPFDFGHNLFIVKVARSDGTAGAGRCTGATALT